MNRPQLRTHLSVLFWFGILFFGRKVCTLTSAFCCCVFSRTWVTPFVCCVNVRKCRLLFVLWCEGRRLLVFLRTWVAWGIVCCCCVRASVCFLGFVQRCEGRRLLAFPRTWLTLFLWLCVCASGFCLNA